MGANPSCRKTKISSRHKNEGLSRDEIQELYTLYGRIGPCELKKLEL